MGRIVKGTPSIEPIAAPDSAEWVAMLVRARAEMKETAILLARKMAEKIVGHAVAVDAQVMRDIAGQALAAAKPDLQDVILRLHPEDLASLAAQRSEWLAAIGIKAEVKLVADPSVGRCGCIVETGHARLDARLGTQLDALERALRPITARP